MAKQRDDRPHSDFSMAFRDPQSRVCLSGGQDGLTVPPDSAAFQTSPSSVPSYGFQRSYPGEIGQGPSFVPGGVAEHYTNPTDDESLLHVCHDQDSIKYLNCLDEFLASHPSGVGMGEDGAYRNRLDFQAISDKRADPSLLHQVTHQHIQPVLGQLLEREYGPILQESFVVSNTPLRQRSPDLLPGTPERANCPLNALTLHTYCEMQTFYRQPRPRVVQSYKNKVRCTWPGCSKTFRKDGRTRHVNETHLRVVKGICARCGKGFQRPYLKRKHELACRVDTPT
ncbi:hypothetical protein K503DRAFT_804485 [Rhizopogon vinicolor AM-OR11-026]|uniref:C2H2-type domain-containing protein n=1 Tax=Rhizopogon vinicolor AM-OR11-026 TaxID=1314800 RepID=A0A1B7ML28_9AGAM|nr:hypothetical protein K503DRAFT_804485 [Rhizopogon vinicolor AM-OR11-026]